jgi:hypothetical protein
MMMNTQTVDALDGHHLLALLVGDWQGTARTWFEPGKLADESPIQGSFRSILGGRFVQYEYHGHLQGAPFEGAAIYGFDPARNCFESSWIDSFHMGSTMMFSQGMRTSTGFWVLGAYADPRGGPDWGWRTTIEIVNPDQIAIRAYNITPEGQEDLAVEAVYQRVTGKG